jgi:hypothetical protein
MLRPRWFCRHEGGFAVWLASIGGCDASILRIGDHWHWLVQHDGVDLAEGVLDRLADAQNAAEAAAPGA